MIPPWTYLDEHDRTVFSTTVAFLNKRLTEPGTIDWALRLKPTQHIERLAIGDLLNSSGGQVLEEPWMTAWRLIEESWSTSAIEDGPSTAIYGIQQRLRAGDRSGAVVSEIVNLVAPRLKAEPISSWHWQFVKKPRRPKAFDQLLSASLTSGDLVDLNVLELAKQTNVTFLKALANALEAAVNHGLDVARRLGWDGQRRLWQLGDLGRTYYTLVGPQAGGSRDEDPDAYHRGIAPSVKLLHAVVSRLAELDVPAALPIVQRWQLAASPIYIRLWAAIARHAQLVSTEEIGGFLLSRDDRQFWDLHVFPEIAELRAVRFGGLDPGIQKAIIARLRKSPPRDHWPKKAETEKVKNARQYWAVREFTRIEVAGNQLPPEAQSWMQSRIVKFPDLANMAIDYGFKEGLTARSLTPTPDDRYNTLQGAARLRALETALSASRGGWDDDPAERANDWLRQPENTDLVLNDLESVADGGDEFSRVWDRFGWAHSLGGAQLEETARRDLQDEATRTLQLMHRLSDEGITAAVDGISNWLGAWSKQVIASPSGLPVWLRVWPIAVEATNARQNEDDDTYLSVSARAMDNDREPRDLDTLNTPAGKLVGVFLDACPSLAQVPNPFSVGSTPLQMREVVISVTGRSGLIARHRLIEALPYFLQADRDWTQQHLIAPLLADDAASVALWSAIARRTHFTEVLKIIGGAMAEKAVDRRLGRRTRRSLVFSLVVEALHAFRESREPAVPNPRILQMLRSIDDEVRAAAADAIQQFVRELSQKGTPGEPPPTSADLFRSAAAPFLQHVWPQERSLATPGVSSALSDLPATSGEAFAEAVELIERFLVPFDCWSMHDYGLYGDDDGEKELSIINDEPKARAFLRLLDSTIGSSEGAVIPQNLADALDQIRTVAPGLVENPLFRRLATTARR